MNKRDKWIHGAIPALLIHCSVGSVYAWSLFVNPISEQIGSNPTAVQFAFSLAIFFLGMSAAFGGSLVEKDVHKSSLISMVSFCMGLAITALSIKFKWLYGIYLGYGCVMGIGLGIGYLTPVKTLMMWFKENKGLATGIAITGFGFASTIASPLITFLMARMSLSMTFLTLGVIYFVPMTIASFLIKKPYKDNVEKSNFKYKTMLKDKNFIRIWFVMFINITCGLALISCASPMMQTYQVAPATIALVVSIMGVTNGFGRLGVAAWSDKLKDRKSAYIDFLLLSAILCFAVYMIKTPWIIIITLIIIPAFYGAGFSCLPALLSDIYGMNNISKIHGLTLTSWAMAGLCGNQISSLTYNITGSYLPVFSVLVIMYAIAEVIMISMNKQ
jgi:OFA family oxalate/formate antiporter-like MFS transporter